ncbi:FAD/NAD(P)-binding domain-containing protein [Xylariaceae sp. AK1471]|nr:FAD/NAD(P)-binding domain-containing protein [Xylariaceae sp. AK1471]
MVTRLVDQQQEGQHDNSNKKLHFVIVGGSLGGLATGLALKSLGHDTTILERNPVPLLQDQGAGIVAGGDTLDFFRRYNRCDRPLAVTSQARQYLNREGKIVHKEAMTQSMTSWDLTYYLMRANYDGVKSPYCEVPDSVAEHGNAVHLHDRNVTDIKEEQGGSRDGQGRAGGGVRVFWESSQGEKGSILADIVVGADGPSSMVRTLVQPNVERTYTGYCALRGTLPEDEASEETRETLCERFTFFHCQGVQILAYLIPGKNGTVEPGKRLLNFVYYTNFPEGSDELEEIMTDRNGRRRAITMPPGMTDPQAWEKQRKLARERLPPQFAEVVCGTKKPFVQAVTDVLSPEHEYWDGKVVLIGDALAGFRPHTVASTSQAAFDAMVFADYIAGKVSREEWKRQTLGFARFIQKRGVDMGEHSQHMDLPLEDHIHDRNVASTPRQEEVYPEWATAF